MQRITALWNRDRRGKIIVAAGAALTFLVVCCVVLFAIGSSARPARNVTAVPPTSAPAAAAASTEPPVATEEVKPTAAPTDAPDPTAVPAPTATETAEMRYVRIAQAGATIPIVRSGAPKGEWKAVVTSVAPEVTLTMPVSIGLSNKQTVRQAKRHVAQVVKALFDGDATLTQVLVFGTAPDGSDGSELPVLSILVNRTAYVAWDGAAENLGKWRIAPRYK